MTDCCPPPADNAQFPEVPDNPPGLSAIRRRIGSFATFRRAMLSDARRPGLLASTLIALRPNIEVADPQLRNPLALRALPALSAPQRTVRQQPGGAGDYETMLIELWAYLADILTFYQERIANEANLPTATQRDSLLRLSELIDFQPSPGTGAETILAFSIEKGKTVTIPDGFQVGGKPPPGAPPPVFETRGPLVASDIFNRIAVPTELAGTWFAHLEDYPLLRGRLLVDPVARSKADLLIGEAVARVYGDAGPLVRPSLGIDPVIVGENNELAAGFSSNEVVTVVPSSGVPDLRYFNDALLHQGGFANAVAKRLRTVVLDGIQNKVAANDWVLVVENERGTDTQHLEDVAVRRLVQVVIDKTAQTTSITWSEDGSPHAQHGYDETQKPVAVYAFRVSAPVFGHNAPGWKALQLAKEFAASQSSPAARRRAVLDDSLDWDNPTNDWYFLPTPADSPAPGDPAQTVFLDRMYDAIKAALDNPSWALMLDGTTPEVRPPENFRVFEAAPASKTAYDLSARVTRLTFDRVIPPRTYPLRSTRVLAASEKLPVCPRVPLADPGTGASLVLSGNHAGLEPGRSVVVRGKVYEPKSRSVAADSTAEVVTIAEPPSFNAASGLTVAPLSGGLANAYRWASLEVLGNAVRADQGQTVADEVLGSGGGGPSQSFPLGRKPLTYLPGTGPEGEAINQSTLFVTVDGVPWAERPNLVGSRPDDHVYFTREDDAQQTTVFFGDGVTGATPQSGRDNVRARYRFGLGSSGNAAPGDIAQLLAALPGVQKVTNPMPATGGVDRASLEEIRARAPESLRTYDRAVCPRDFALLAETFGNVTKATAVWEPDDPRSAGGAAVAHVRVTVGLADHSPLVPGSAFSRRLRSFLGSRSAPGLAVRLLGFKPVEVDVVAAIDLEGRAPRAATLAAAVAALNPGKNADGSFGFFAYERLGIGQSIALSAVYAALQGVSGVRAAYVTTLNRVDQSGPLPADVLIGPTELAVITNDPAQTEPKSGTLTVTIREGGFLE